jgi:hypothetical protein
MKLWLDVQEIGSMGESLRSRNLKLDSVVIWYCLPTDVVFKPCCNFEVFTALIMKNGIFWDVMPRGSCRNRRFGGTVSVLTRATWHNIPEEAIPHTLGVCFGHFPKVLSSIKVKHFSRDVCAQICLGIKFRGLRPSKSLFIINIIISKYNSFYYSIL